MVSRRRRRGGAVEGRQKNAADAREPQRHNHRKNAGKKFREKGISLPKDNEVSTTHAKIELKNDEIVLVDVGSTNGTSVDGEPIEEGKPHPLAAGNTVVFGASTFTVSEIKAA